MRDSDPNDEKVKILMASIAFFLFVGLAVGAAMWGLLQ